MSADAGKAKASPTHNKSSTAGLGVRATNCWRKAMARPQARSTENNRAWVAGRIEGFTRAKA
jgi:hypothetical protein